MAETACDYAAIAETLKTYLGLDGSPVAFRFAHTKEEIPEGMEEAPETLRHCRMIAIARHEGKVFFAPSEKHLCNGGAWSLGLRPLTESLKTGDFYDKVGKFGSRAACRRTIDRIPHLSPGETYATMYAPLEATPFDPEIVLIVTSSSTDRPSSNSTSTPCSGSSVRPSPRSSSTSGATSSRRSTGSCGGSDRRVYSGERRAGAHGEFEWPRLPVTTLRSRRP